MSQLDVYRGEFDKIGRDCAYQQTQIVKVRKRLSDTEVRELRLEFAHGAIRKELAYKYGVSGPTVVRILQGKRRKNVK